MRLTLGVAVFLSWQAQAADGTSLAVTNENIDGGLQSFAWASEHQAQWTCLQKRSAGPVSFDFELRDGAVTALTTHGGGAQKPVAARQSPASKGTTVDITVAGATTQWVKGAFEWSVDTSRTEFFLTSQAHVWVVQGNTRTLLDSFIVYGRRGRMSPYWSPKGEHLAIGLEYQDADLEHADSCLVEGVTTGPSIEWVVNPMPRAVKQADWPGIWAHQQHLRERVRSLGFNVPVVTTGQKARTSTVIYAPKGKWTEQLERLKRLTAAPVEPLTWKSPCDVVIAMVETADGGL